MLFFCFLLLKNTEMCLILECKNVTFLQFIRSPVHCLKSVTIVRLFDLILRIYLSKILLKSCIKVSFYTIFMTSKYAKSMWRLSTRMVSFKSFIGYEIIAYINYHFYT